MPISTCLSPLPPLQPGDMLANGKYEIIELTHNPGGFGRIYRAYGGRMYHNGSREIFAIKEFYVREYDDLRWDSMLSYTRNMSIRDYELLIAKFYMEAKMLSLLYSRYDNHMPKIYGQVWEEPDGRLLYAMTYVKGSTMRELMESHEKGYTMPEEMAVDYIVQIGKVLHKSHVMGLVHADVSPNNIMKKNHSNYAVLVDWGNAKSYNDELVLKSLNRTELEFFQPYQEDLDQALSHVGNQQEPWDEELPMSATWGYTAPEEFWGKPQADVYSLAATLFYLLTGECPMELTDEGHINRAYRMLEEHNVSPTTTKAILHAMNVYKGLGTESIKEFLTELPQDIVINTLLKYQDH